MDVHGQTGEAERGTRPTPSRDAQAFGIALVTAKLASTSQWRVSTSRPRLLVVDDDADVVALLASWLTTVGDVYTATTSAQALALAAAVSPRLAVVDVVLPRMDGFDLAGALRRQPDLADIPIIFVTGSDRLDIFMRADELGAATVLYKPIDQDALHEAVVSLLQHPPAGV